MIGNNYNNQIDMNNQRGQILLIIIMLMAVVTTVVLAVSFTSITETQISKLEEENKKALAAAEAGIESAIRKRANVSFGSGELTSITGYTGGANIVPAVSGTEFISPLIQKDDQYTLYLAQYTPGPPATYGPSTNQNVRVCFASAGGAPPAIEIALIKSGAAPIIRYVVDPSSRITNALFATAGCAGVAGYSYSYTIPAADIGVNARFLVVRTLYTSTRFAFAGSGSLPTQGLLVESTATASTTGVTKKVRLFQSYPQLPPEFFSTSF